jgi:N6-adenosine-specific RNA methylase IME4
MQEEALDVARAWGFRVVTEIVWVKTQRDIVPRLQIGMGSYTRAAHETCLVAVRGKAASSRLSAAVPSVFFAPKLRHSEKPQEFFDLVERLAPGPRIELFARKRRPRWDAEGIEL